MPYSHNQSANFTVDCIIESPSTLQKFIKDNFTKTRGYKPSRAMRLCLHLLSHIQEGQLDLVMPNGASLRFGKQNDQPRAMVRIHDDRAVKRFLTHGKLGFCETYLDGDWSSPDMATFFELILLNAATLQKKLLGKKWTRLLSRALHIMRPNSKKGSRKNIYSHYDIGNDFYTQWLDPSMTYSSALFTDGNTDLEKAQQRKYKEMADRLGLKPEHHLLEIGCGWGGFIEYVVTHIGCRVTAVTISKAQHEYATKRIEKLDVSNKVDIRLQDYRDITGKFDRIASIEMFEAVGESYWHAFFQTIKNRLHDDGRAVLQIITISEEDFENYRKTADYIQRYIFPGGMLPSMNALSEQIKAAGLKQGEHLSFGRDYAHTLKLWNQAFQKSWPKLTSPKMNTRFKRVWEQYLCYCEAGFNVGSIDVIQINIDAQ